MEKPGNPAVAFTEAKRHHHKAIDMRRFGRDADWMRRVAAQYRQQADQAKVDLMCLDKCPICGHCTLLPLAEIYGYPYVECESCGHVFQQRPPSSRAIAEFYTKSGNNEHVVQRETYINDRQFAERVDVIAGPKAEFVTRCVSLKGKWVDIGCGVGDMVLSAKAMGWNAVGVESDPPEVAYGRSKGAEIFEEHVNAENASRLVSDATVVSMFNILEHLIDPSELLGVVSGAMPGNSFLAFEVPRHPSLSSYTNRLFPDLVARHMVPPVHLHIFSERSCEVMLQKAGLVAEHVWLFGQDIHELLLALDCMDPTPDRPLFKLLHASAGLIQKGVDEADLSDSMIVVARKK